MSQAERGLFEHLEHINGFESHDNRMLILRDATKLVCEEFELAYGGLKNALEHERKSHHAAQDRIVDLEQRLAEAERDIDKAHTLIQRWIDLQEKRKAANNQQPHSDYWPEAIGRAEQKLRDCIEPKPDFSLKTGYVSISEQCSIPSPEGWNINTRKINDLLELTVYAPDGSQNILTFSNAASVELLKSPKEDEIKMIYNEEQRKQISEMVKGKIVESLRYDEVDNYWAITFEDGPEMCFRFMAELVG